MSKEQISSELFMFQSSTAVAGVSAASNDERLAASGMRIESMQLQLQADQSYIYEGLAREAEHCDAFTFLVNSRSLALPKRALDQTKSANSSSGLFSSGLVRADAEERAASSATHLKSIPTA